MTFLDGCFDALLTPAQFYKTVATSSLYKVEQLEFSLAEVDIQGCGPITYRLLDSRTGEELLAPEFKINASVFPPVVEVLTSTQAYLNNSPFDIVIEASLGEYATEASDSLVLFVDDPCYSTEII